MTVEGSFGKVCRCAVAGVVVMAMTSSAGFVSTTSSAAAAVGTFPFGCITAASTNQLCPPGSPTIVGAAGFQMSWGVNARGSVYTNTLETARSLGNVGLKAPMVAIALGNGLSSYWLVAADGGVFAFGEAHFYGSLGRLKLQAPIVGVAATHDGKGYWLVGADGGVFAFGDAHFYGSLGRVKLQAPIVGVTATPDGRGYWLVGADGGVFAFGDARFFGSLAGVELSRPIVGIASDLAGDGYWLVGKDGGIFTFGKADFHGSLVGQARSLVITVSDYFFVNLPPFPLPETTDESYCMATNSGQVYCASF
jgi:hypothetical protein